MNEINIFGQRGYLSDVQRKLPLEHNTEDFKFLTCMDLSWTINITAYGSPGKQYSISAYSKNIAEFILWWSINVMPDLNGFSGFHNLKFEPIDFKLTI